MQYIHAMQRAMTVFGLLTLVACGSDKSAADQCCSEFNAFDDERVYASADGETLYFHVNGAADWKPVDVALSRGSYRVCGESVWVDVTAGTESLEECMLVSKDGITLGSQGKAYTRTN